MSSLTPSGPNSTPSVSPFISTPLIKSLSIVTSFLLATPLTYWPAVPPPAALSIPIALTRINQSATQRAVLWRSGNSKSIDNAGSNHFDFLCHWYPLQRLLLRPRWSRKLDIAISSALSSIRWATLGIPLPTAPSSYSLA